jgi:Flp pilus assembly protein TadD
MIVSRAARAAFLVAIAAQMGCVGRDTRPQQHGTIAGAGDERIGPSAESDPIVTTRTREQVSAVAPVPAAHRTRRADEPEGAEVLDARALAYLAQGRLELAEDAANRALAVTARFAPAHNTLGLVHVRRGELDLARAEFARARQIDPALFAAFMNEGALALDARLYAEALGLFTRAVEIRPTDYDAWISVGVARRGMGDPAGARAAYEHAQSMDPTRPEAYFDLAVLLEHDSDGTEPTSGPLERCTSTSSSAPERDTSMPPRSRGSKSAALRDVDVGGTATGPVRAADGQGWSRPT